ncbi:hypothetical protein [Curvibacter sp. AEP1-3]|uniref:hypothetical protein n=1 Tax=Curvibacter sp. AEP1-3 TaxID=1844971 RepID=UPI000B3C962D|nr:hypothetical protein [Curvibacter sp. AEP1-3]
MTASKFWKRQALGAALGCSLGIYSGEGLNVAVKSPHFLRLETCLDKQVPMANIGFEMSDFVTHHF